MSTFEYNNVVGSIPFMRMAESYGMAQIYGFFIVWIPKRSLAQNSLRYNGAYLFPTRS